MMRFVVLALILVSAGRLVSARADPPPPLMLEDWTDDDTRMAAVLMSFACKASPGEDLTACEAASRLRRKLADAKRAPSPVDSKPAPPPE